MEQRPGDHRGGYLETFALGQRFDFGQRFHLGKSGRKPETQARGFISQRSTQSDSTNGVETCGKGAMQSVVDDFLRSHAAINAIAISPEHVLDRDPTAQEPAGIRAVGSTERLDEADQFLKIKQIERDLKMEQTAFLVVTLQRVFDRAGVGRVADLLEQSRD